jgi:hypothetical protein
MTIELAWAMIVGIWWGVAIGLVAFSPLILGILLWSLRR